MKKIFKLLLLSIVSLGMFSCDDQEDLIILTPPAEFSILTPDTGAALTLTPELVNNPAVTIAWSQADYGAQSPVVYFVEIARNGTEFENPLVGGTTSNTNLTWTVAELNSAALAAGLAPTESDGLDIRIKATTGTNESQAVYSNVITVLITTYTTELPRLAVPGNHQGWDPPTAPTLAASAFGASDYEGFVYLDGGYKFVAPDNAGAFVWGNTDWADDGTNTGVLVVENETDCMAAAGYYKVLADTEALTYSTTLTNWGIIGAATPAGWDASTPMTYNSTSKKWEIVVSLSAGEFKFRANDAWAMNFGGDAENLTQDGDNLSVDAGGTYLVELDLSNPRSYSYSITAQ
jgi:hypothetical protein